MRSTSRRGVAVCTTCGTRRGFCSWWTPRRCPGSPATVPEVGAAVDPEHSVAAAGIEVPTDDATSAAIRAWLVSVGAENLVVAADRDFGSVRYFAPGASIEPEAHAAGTALAWLVVNSGFTVSTHWLPKP
jgi:hypothetical protein